ncbi:MAG: hypothetical protein J1F03_01970 [Oscillospiraceae bacterium]|nr:hypothetical protein [Oscillospiraceae bacterium]
MENIVLCFAVTLASAFIWFDYYYFFMDILRPIVSVLLMFTWIWCGFLSGRDKKWGFLIFTGAYWLVPYLYILWYRASSDMADNAVITLLYRFSYLLFEWPLRTIEEFTKCEVNIWALSLVILVFTAFFAGKIIVGSLKDKEQSGDPQNSEKKISSDDEC